LSEDEGESNRSVTLTFSGGQEVEIELRNRPPLPPYFVPTERFVDIYDELAAAALVGEAAAAVQLYRNLSTCRHAHRSQRELDDALDQLHEEGAMAWPGHNGDVEFVPEGFDKTAYANSLKRAYVRCEGLDSDQISQAENWIRLAVQNGEYMGTRFLTEELGRTEESFDLWQAAWDEGHINAAQALIMYYRDDSPDAVNGAPDYIKTYAFQLIRNKVRLAANEFSDMPNPQMAQAYDDALKVTSGFLNPQEQREAEQLAIEILSANENCCIGTWQ